jgi:hypothetical protein
MLLCNGAAPVVILGLALITSTLQVCFAQTRKVASVLPATFVSDIFGMKRAMGASSTIVAVDPDYDRGCEHGVCCSTCSYMLVGELEPDCRSRRSVSMTGATPPLLQQKLTSQA